MSNSKGRTRRPRRPDIMRVAPGDDIITLSQRERGDSVGDRRRADQAAKDEENRAKHAKASAEHKLVRDLDPDSDEGRAARSFLNRTVYITAGDLRDASNGGDKVRRTDLAEQLTLDAERSQAEDEWAQIEPKVRQGIRLARRAMKATFDEVSGQADAQREVEATKLRKFIDDVVMGGVGDMVAAEAKRQGWPMEVRKQLPELIHSLFRGGSFDGNLDAEVLAFVHWAFSDTCFRLVADDYPLPGKNNAWHTDNVEAFKARRLHLRQTATSTTSAPSKGSKPAQQRDEEEEAFWAEHADFLAALKARLEAGPEGSPFSDKVTKLVVRYGKYLMSGKDAPEALTGGKPVWFGRRTFVALVIELKVADGIFAGQSHDWFADEFQVQTDAIAGHPLPTEQEAEIAEVEPELEAAVA